MRLIDGDALMPLFVEKANKMKDRHGVKIGDPWLLNYEDIKDVIDNVPTVKLTESDIQETLRPRCMTVITNEFLMSLLGDPDRFTIEELRAWLYQNAMNNYGTEYEKNVIEIIKRLDGFVRFCKDRRTET